MERIVIRHLAGSKVNQTEIFPLAELKELTFGRDAAANVKYDPERDDLVSRMHAKITRDPINPTLFNFTDLNSRNGSFVNRTKVTGSTRIEPGDVIQLGPGGAEFQFDVEPRPEGVARSTRVAPGPGATRAPETRESRATAAPGGTSPTAAAGSGHSPVGRATVERLIAQNQGSTRKYLINGAAVLLALIIAVGGGLWYQNRRGEHEAEQRIASARTDLAHQQAAQLEKLKAEQPKTPAEIAQAYADSVVYIEVAWKLIYTETGKQFYQRTIPTCMQFDKKRRCLSEADIPAYWQLSDGTIEPWLTLDDRRGANIPIGMGNLRGSGFVVKEEGFILTNRHVAASWQTRWEPKLPGFLCDLPAANQTGECKVRRELGPEDAQAINWVPSKPKILPPSLSGKAVEGRHDYLDVTFPKTKLRIPARLVRVSDVADVSLIKIDVPQPVKPVDLAIDDAVQAGDTITVLGYPGVSAETAVRVKSQDPMNREDEWRVVPDPTVTPGNIGKVIHGELTPQGGSSYDYFSEMGDVYQLTVNATGEGNSGGPVFDARGQVIGIFTYGKRDPTGIQISFAVPIRHGADIMGIQRVVK